MDEKPPQEQMAEVLDILVAKGLVRGYVRDLKRGMVVDWTDDGRAAIETVWDVFRLVGGPEEMTQEHWYTLAFIASLHAGHYDDLDSN